MKLPLVACALTLVASLPRPDLDKEKALEHGRTAFQHFLAGEVDLVWDEFDDAMKKALGALSEDQRRRWDDLVGEPFPFEASGEK